MVHIGAMYMGGNVRPKQFARSVESNGFDSLWAGDHIIHYVDGIATLGAFAGATDAIPLGTAVIVVPFRPAAVTAKGIWTAGWIAERSIMAGVGPGGDVPSEFELVGADIRSRGAYTDEALEVMTRLWDEEHVSFHGRWSHFDDVTLLPRPAPRPEVWIGGRSDASLRRTVRYGTGYLPYLISPEQLAERTTRLRAMAREAGREPDQIQIGCTTFLIPGRTVQESIEVGAAKVGFRNVSEENIRRYYLLGNVDDCVSRLREYVAAGAEKIVLGCALGQAKQLETFVDYCRELLPEVRSLAGV